jgi:hypothetical protein
VIHKLINSVWNKEEVPDQWTESIIVAVKIRIYKTIILPVVLYGCETCSLTLRDEHRLSVFENRMLRRIFRLKRDEVTGEGRKLHNEELRNWYSSPSIIRIIKSSRMRFCGSCSTNGGEEERV